MTRRIHPQYNEDYSLINSKLPISHIVFLLFTILLTGSNLFATPLPASDVFQLTIKPIDPNTIGLQWHIKPGYFLYKNKINVNEQPNSNFQLGTIRFPEPKLKIDKQGHPYPIYRDTIELTAPVLGHQGGEGLIDVQYQGCSDEGFCYPPMRQSFKLAFNKELALTDTALMPTSDTPPSTIPHEKTSINPFFAGHNWFMIALSFFGFGLLLAFTPCVLPMVPVLSGIIVGHGSNLSTRKAFWLSFSYVISMSITYAAVGAMVATVGRNLQVFMQAPWIIGLFSALFVLLSLSMFGCYELRLPLALQATLGRFSRHQGSGHYLGAALMGCLSTLILSPCVTAPLIGVLSYIAQTGNIIMGSMALFVLGLGMGTPLLLIGTSAGKWLPKTGMWMNAVKHFFGVLMLAVAIYLLDRLLPPMITMILWASLLIIWSMHVGAFIKATSTLARFRQGIGILLLSYGLLILIGASQGHKNPLQPLVSDNEPALPLTASTATRVVTNLSDAQTAIAAAKGRPVMIDFYADWCVSCKEMAATTLKNSAVLGALASFSIIKVDVTASTKETQALLAYFKVVAPPTFLFLNANGTILQQFTLVGDIKTTDFLNQLNHVLAER